MDGLRLLPPKPGTCPKCATAHAATDPHNAASLYYLYRFKAAHGRWPTWADALAHCDQVTQDKWEVVLRVRCHWSEPAAGVATIAEPINEGANDA